MTSGKSDLHWMQDAPSTSSWGKARRTRRLQGADGYSVFLALDHGASLGPLPGVADVAGALRVAAAATMSGAVLNPHWLKRQPIVETVPIIAQLMSLPASEATRYDQKVLYGTIDLAIQVDASAIAVQIRLDGAHLADTVSQITGIVESADSFGLPVLFMINLGAEGWHDGGQPAFTLRVAGEMGADYIKLPAPPALSDLEEEAFVDAIKRGPPVLLAGGPKNDNFFDTIERCARLGYSGVCVGRNVLQAESPISVVEQIRRTLANFHRPMRPQSET